MSFFSVHENRKELDIGKEIDRVHVVKDQQSKYRDGCTMYIHACSIQLKEGFTLVASVSNLRHVRVDLNEGSWIKN